MVTFGIKWLLLILIAAIGSLHYHPRDSRDLIKSSFRLFFQGISLNLSAGACCVQIVPTMPNSSTIWRIRTRTSTGQRTRWPRPYHQSTEAKFQIICSSSDREVSGMFYPNVKGITLVDMHPFCAHPLSAPHTQGCGKEEMIETISKFLHVPLLVIHDAHQLRSYASRVESYVARKLLEYSSYDVKKASSGIVVFCNVNRLSLDLQRSMARLMRGNLGANIEFVCDS
jgi:hypothetical protein